MKRLDASESNEDFLARLSRAARQEQFLHVVSRDEAASRFRAAVPHVALPSESVPLAATLGRALARDVASPIDVPPFDRALVDGFALRSSDTLGASEAEPARLGLNHEILACGVAPRLAVEPGTATTIATGGMIPRGADAVVMVEATEIASGEGALAIDLDRGAAPGQFVGYAGSDMARGETVLRKGTVVTAREIGMLAACGLDAVEMVRRPRVAVLSTGDELSPPGQTLPAAGIYDSNGAIVSASVTENGGEPVPFGIVADDEAALESAIRAALSECDVVVLSGGTSKGAGDVSHRILSRLGEPGILVHGVALKPGKPLCLAKAQGKAIVVLPGFPTSAIFTFHEFVVPLIRSLAGLPPREEESVEAVLPRRIPSELGRMEFVMASLAHGRDAPVAVPLSKGSGSVTAFSQADGFFAIPAARAGLEAGEPVRLSRIGAGTRAPRPHHRRQPLRRARCRRRTPGRARHPGPHDLGRLLRGARRPEAGRVRDRLDASLRSHDRPLQCALPDPSVAPRRGLDADAGIGVPPRRQPVRGTRRGGCPSRRSSSTRTPSWWAATPARGRASSSTGF